MASILRDSSFGQLMQLCYGWNVAPYEDEKPDFELHRVISPEEQTPEESKNTSERNAKDRFEASSMHSRYEEVDNTVNVLHFGPNDPDDPQQWSLAKKTLFYIQICLLTFAVYSGSAIISPAEPTFETMWGTTPETSVLPLSMYVLGYGLGPLIFSPMSEIPDVGRNVSYISSLFIFIILTAVGSAVSNFPGLVVIRLLQGFFGGPVLATGPASAQDVFAPNKLPYALATWAIFTWAGPALGPAFSGFAISLDTWRWGMWETLIICVGVFVMFFFFLPESNPEYILKQRAIRLRRSTGDTSIRTRAELHTSSREWVKLTVYHLTMPFKITILDPAIFFVNLYLGLLYGVYYSFFESFPLVYAGVYGFSVGISSLIFISVLIGGCCGLAIYLILIWFIYEPYTLRNGIGRPEERLFPANVAASFMPTSLFLFGYLALPENSWVSPTVGVVLFATCAFIVLNCLFVYLPMGYPRYVASVFAANGFFRSAMACGAIHFSIPLFKNLGIGNGCAILGSAATLLAGIFMILYAAGPYLRARSKFADTY